MILLQLLLLSRLLLLLSRLLLLKTLLLLRLLLLGHRVTPVQTISRLLLVLLIPMTSLLRV